MCLAGSRKRKAGDARQAADKRLFVSRPPESPRDGGTVLLVRLSRSRPARLSATASRFGQAANDNYSESISGNSSDCQIQDGTHGHSWMVPGLNRRPAVLSSASAIG